MLDFVFTGTDGAAPRSGYDNLLTLTLSAADFSAVNAAPQFVEFQVTNVAGADTPGPNGSVYDPRYHEIVYLWDFGDEVNATPATALNMPNAWKDLNKAFGRKVGHVFKSPGPKTVTCYAYEPSTRRFGYKTVEVIVGNPDEVFSGNRTIIFNPGGAASTSAYPGATVITSNWDAVVVARNARGATACRILLAPGITISGRQLAAPTNWSNIRIGPLDPASPKPTIGPRGKDGQTSGDGPFFRDWDNDCKETVLYGINFAGGWDSTTQLGYVHQPFSINKNAYTGNYMTLFAQCDFSGFDTIQGPFLGNSNATLREAFFDCSITNWQDYGFFSSSMPNNATYLAGCSIEQNVDALSGGEKIDLFNQHSCVRIMNTEHLSLRGCSLFARNGWSISGRLGGYRRTAVNPALRINAGSQANASTYVDRCTVEGEIVIQDQNRTNNVPGNHVIDKVVQILGSDQYSQAFEIRHGGVTIRNLLSVKLGLPEAIDSEHMEKFLFLSNSAGTAGNGDVPQKIYNNTFIDLRNNAQAKSATVALLKEGDAIFSDVTLTDNIFEQPNRSPSLETDDPIDLLASIGVSPRGKGPRYDFLLPEGTIAGTIPTGGTLSVPYALVTESRYNNDKINYGSATNQVYWTANQGQDTRHKIRVNDVTYHAENGQFTVAFTPTNITLTNTSGTAWTGRWILKLDRTTRLPDFEPQYDATGLTVPTGKPQAGSAALTAGGSADGYDDLLGNKRPAMGDTKGCLL